MKSLLVVLSIFLFPFYLSAENLRDLLERNHIPLTTFRDKELDGAVLSWNAQTLKDVVWLAYTGESEDVLDGVLYVVRYDPRMKTVRRKAFTEKKLSYGCAGAVLEISEAGSHVLIVTHINPSASCTIVLNAKTASAEQTVMGWPLAHLGSGTSIFEENEVHFADDHPLRLALVDLASKKTTEIYPVGGDSVSKLFLVDYRKKVPQEPMCETQCGPKHFEEDLRFGPTTDGDDSFAFVTSRIAEGVDDWYGLYVYRKNHKGWQFCSRHLKDDEAADMGARLPTAFDSVANACTEFHEVTASLLR